MFFDLWACVPFPLLFRRVFFFILLWNFSCSLNTLTRIERAESSFRWRVLKWSESLRETEVDGRREEGKRKGGKGEAETLSGQNCCWSSDRKLLPRRSTAQFTSRNALDSTSLSPSPWHGSPPSVPESFPLNSLNTPSGSTKGTKWQLFAPNRHRTQGWRLCCTCSSSCWPGLVGVWVIQNPAFWRASEQPADTGRTEIRLRVTEGAADQNTHEITRLFRGL